MTIYLLILIFINGSGDIESVRHMETYASKQHCHKAVGNIMKSKPPKGVWLSCVPTNKTGRMVL